MKYLIYIFQNFMTKKTIRDFSKIIEKGWLNKLEPFLLSTQFDQIANVIKNDILKITPLPNEIFRCFQSCRYDDLKIIICGMDPYTGIIKNERIADGLAFSSRNSVNKPPKSLEVIYKAIESDLNIALDRRNNDLTYLANQGILLINSALTTEVGKTGVHLQLWKSFMIYLFRMLDNTCSGLIYIFMGKTAQEYSKLISINRNYIFKVEHPAASVYHGGIWQHNEIFLDIQKIMKTNFNNQIKFNIV